ncbi:MAG: tRNA threonylcarbamoyladenosine dehydratase [Ruminococcaceae bacterium]|nr:tRNA threonylcarbamoyladenosine dehydratase [Oscillospiraceae bacterium]
MSQFQRTQMLIGKDSQNALINSSVAVFGIGGVGSYVCEALARAGIGKFMLCDNDIVSESNINRQLIALHSTLGKPKTSVMAQRIKDINPAAEVREMQTFFSAENANDFDFNGFSYIIDAIDTVSSKIALISQAKKQNIPIISCMGTGNKLNPTLFEITDIFKTNVCPLARVMRKELKNIGITSLKVLYSKEIPKSKVNTIPQNGRHIPGSISFVPSAAGLIIAGEVICDICKIERIN